MSLPITQSDAEHEVALLERLRPPDWKNPTPSGRYNLVVIGAGTAGLVTAAGSAGLGAKVALIERGLFGGDCLNSGCVPSKALLRSARAAAEARSAHDLGVCIEGEVKVDFEAVMSRMRALRARIAEHDAVARFQALGVDVFLGEARFSGRDSVRVDDVELHFARACIATGSRPRVPAIDGLEAAGYLTNETLFDLAHLPRRFAVVGGGPIGCEMAQAFARFGSKVVLVQSGERILEHDDPDAAAIVQKLLVADGIDIRFGRKLESVERRADGRLLRLSSTLGPEEVVVDELLLGVGRAPVVDGLDLDAAGIEADEKRGILVDDHLRTSNPRVFAAGDVCLSEKFTHTADAAARIVIQNALFFGRAKKSRLCIPWCTYTEPELAHTGLSAKEARERGHDVVTEEVPFADVDRAIVDAETEGFLRIHADAKSGRILGATIVGEHAGEMISPITAAIVAGTKLTELSGVIHPYPTRSEAMRKAADPHRRRDLTPFRQRLLQRFLAWRR